MTNPSVPSVPSVPKIVLISGATGDTGRPAVSESIARGLKVRAFVHSVDARAQALADLGAEVVEGDLLDINTVRPAMEGVDAAYFVWPVQPGLIHATVNFAQAAKEAGVGGGDQFVAALCEPVVDQRFVP
jgi:NAD(P)H dehydrogenase (quinone)